MAAISRTISFRVRTEAEANLRAYAEAHHWTMNEALNLIFEGKVKFEKESKKMTTNELPSSLDADERAELISGINLEGYCQPVSEIIDGFIAWQATGGPMDDLRHQFHDYLFRLQFGKF
jgi:hypothetical protein